LHKSNGSITLGEAAKQLALPERRVRELISDGILIPVQIEHLSSLRYINSVDEHMRIVSSVKVLDNADQHDNAVLLVLDIFIDDKHIDKLSFNLHDYA
jgi:phage antirepressor YoqD-like protein